MTTDQVCLEDLVNGHAHPWAPPPCSSLVESTARIGRRPCQTWSRAVHSLSDNDENCRSLFQFDCPSIPTQNLTYNEHFAGHARYRIMYWPKHLFTVLFANFSP